MLPSFSTRSSRMTSMGEALLFHAVGEQAEVAGALDRLGQLALLLARHRGDAARHDLATLGHEALQQADVLVVDDRRVLTLKRAALAAAEEWACHVLPRFLGFALGALRTGATVVAPAVAIA